MAGSRWVTTPLWKYRSLRGFPGGNNGKEPTCQCRRHKRHGFDPWGGEDPLEVGMATHSSILAWRTPWTEKPGRLQFTEKQRVRYKWSDLACRSLRPFLYSSSVCACHLFISSASVRSLPFLSFIMPILAWNFPLVFPIFLKRSLLFPIYCFPLFLCVVHLRSSYLSLLFSGTLHWVSYLSLFPLIWESSSDYFAFLFFFFFGMV